MKGFLAPRKTLRKKNLQPLTGFWSGVPFLLCLYLPRGSADGFSAELGPRSPWNYPRYPRADQMGRRRKLEVQDVEKNSATETAPFARSPKEIPTLYPSQREKVPFPLRRALAGLCARNVPSWPKELVNNLLSRASTVRRGSRTSAGLNPLADT